MAKDLRKENAEIALTILTMKLAIQYHALSHSIVSILRGSVLQLGNSHGDTIQPDRLPLRGPQQKYQDATKYIFQAALLMSNQSAYFMVKQEP